MKMVAVYILNACRNNRFLTCRAFTHVAGALWLLAGAGDERRHHPRLLCAVGTGRAPVWYPFALIAGCEGQTVPSHQSEYLLDGRPTDTT